MKTIKEKLGLLKSKLENKGTVKIMIIGLGSVGCYLLDYLVSLSDPQLEIIVVGRNKEKMQMDVNIIRTAATIRHQLRSKITIYGNCDLNDVESITNCLKIHNPDFIVNSSRVYSGLKYGSISWHNFRAYGIWTPLSITYAKNIMMAYGKAGCHAISINTSYSDAVIPWLKSAGLPYFDFGSGNLNHLIPRMKFYVSEKYGIANLNDIDITMAVSHFHDVVISKEGQSEGQELLIDVRYHGEKLDVDQTDLLKHCVISMPVDQKRNMMNASSNFDIINSILVALRERKKVKVHTPGVEGHIGGYPYIIDGTTSSAYVDTSIWSMEEMEKANALSIYCDGIADVKDGYLVYSDELQEKVKRSFGVEIPKVVHFKDIPSVAQLLIEKIINVALNKK